MSAGNDGSMLHVHITGTTSALSLKPISVPLLLSHLMYRSRLPPMVLSASCIEASIGRPATDRVGTDAVVDSTSHVELIAERIGDALPLTSGGDEGAAEAIEPFPLLHLGFQDALTLGDGSRRAIACDEHFDIVVCVDADAFDTVADVYNRRAAYGAHQSSAGASPFVVVSIVSEQTQRLPQLYSDLLLLIAHAWRDEAGAAMLASEGRERGPTRLSHRLDAAIAKLRGTEVLYAVFRV